MKILIGADVVSTNSNEDFFSNGQITKIMDDSVLNVLNDHDYRLINLETPLFDGNSPIQKCGPNLRCPSAMANGLYAMHVDIVTLANNHIFDHGSEGLLSTEEVLSRTGIAFFGAGENRDVARRPFIIENDGLKIGVYGCCEHEFSFATNTTPGANPFDPIDSFDDVHELSNNVDYIIVLYHGGKEYYRYPSPWLQRVCRKFILSGADLVVCQHSHCIGCEETFENGKIVYGQGNFIFDLKSDEFWNTGLLLSLNFETKKKCNIQYIPIEKNDGRITVSQDKSIVESFKQRSEEILKPEFIEKNYSIFSQKYYSDYLISLSGKRNLFERVLNRLTKGKSRDLLLSLKHNSQSLTTVLNYIECEAHRELLIEGIRNRIYK